MSTQVDHSVIDEIGVPNDFFRNYWKRQPGHFKRADRVDPNSHFGLNATAELLVSRGIRPPFIRVLQDRKPIDFSAYSRRGRHGSGVELIDPQRLMALFKEGASIVLQGLDEIWAPLNSVCRALEIRLNTEVHANAYVTPPNAQALPIHTDAHDVIALQVHGRKRWLVYPTAGLNSIEGVEPLDVDLREGETLYVPREAPHVAATSSETSIHVALAILSSDQTTSEDSSPELTGSSARDLEHSVRRALMALDTD